MIQIDKNSQIFKEDIPLCTTKVHKQSFINALRGLKGTYVYMTFLKNNNEFIITDGVGTTTSLRVQFYKG